MARWGFLAVAALALWNTLRHAELGRAADLALGIGPKVALVAVPFFVAMMLQTAGYARILTAVSGVRRGFWDYVRLLTVMLSTEAVLLAVPAGAAIAETINPYLLKRRLGVPISEGLAASVTKKAAIVFTNGIYIGIAVLFGAGYLQSASRALIGAGGLSWLVAASGLAMLVAALVMSRVLFSGTVASRSHGLLSRIPSARLRAYLDARKSGFVETDAHFAGLIQRGRPALATSLVFMLGCWLAEGAEAFVILRLLGVDMPFAEVLAFEVVVSLLRSLAFMVPAGLGVQDAGYVAFLGAFGVPDAATLGVAFVLVKRARELLFVAVGFLLFIVLGDAPTSSAPALAEPSLERI
ncbi:Hypothetical protein A7982_08413 [Minicystis rosea]|nr:Hypothetical protein A7982_08413 [Minicystis rosea]